MLFGLFLGCVLLQNTWVVDDDGGAGVDFTDLAAAVAAATDGDVVLVRPGSYGAFVLSGKGLRIRGQPSAQVSAATISDVPSSSRVLLERLEFPRASLSCAPSLLVSGSRTRITLADVVATGGLNCSYPPGCALLVDSAEAMVLRSNLTGGPGFVPLASTGGPGGPALIAEGGARVYVVDSTLVGGNGSGGYQYGGNGGPAVYAASTSHVWIASSIVTGGSLGFGGAVSGSGGVGIRGEDSARIRGSGPSSTISGAGGLYSGALGIRVSDDARAVVHATAVLVGDSFVGGPAAPQVGGFISTGPLPSLHVLPLRAEVTLTLSNGPASAPFSIWIEGDGSLRPHLPTFGIVGDLALHPDWSRPMFRGVLSLAGESSFSVPLSTFPSVLYQQLRLQAGVMDPRRGLLLSNPIEFTAKQGPRNTQPAR